MLNALSSVGPVNPATEKSQETGRTRKEERIGVGWGDREGEEGGESEGLGRREAG